MCRLMSLGVPQAVQLELMVERNGGVVRLWATKADGVSYCTIVQVV